MSGRGRVWGLTLPLVGTLTLVGSLTAAEPQPQPERPRASGDSKADFLFRALERSGDHALTRREFSVLMDPPGFRPRMLRQVRRKMGFFGKLPGMQGLMDKVGREPPFSRKNHRLWVAEFDRNEDGVLDSGERALAAGMVLGRFDADRDGYLDRSEFAALIADRRAKVAAADAAGSP